ncbi:TIGR03619 family F420-dependent LLM class oxidoreductase [Streptacidiphilus sp. PB12-B1b]|uniref:TIGR03619 family F420-dependent LLM class oxidoreductase n=1 Tax=Streptacidiphilus sp. PB12-B1b TaxID=2705012 RepID=UPI0015FE33E6|nr:TIGR03619 family F420-dependent LLM class oxidoreductase [Streptacidiphilus sp. PB12-B1b]QMU79402.1 TIGR03619 family F420-dependent LLM class oxidoreductase [Streptacidiphilus sp. PB12-B1b]
MPDATSPSLLQYGIQLPVQSQSTLYREPWETTAGPDELARAARAADRLGYAYIACCDHVAIPARLADAMGTTWYDPVSTLGWLAALTTRTLLLSHVAVAPLRHPLLSAKQYATLDLLSGGRLLLGVGAGHVPEEFEALGVDFHQRGPVLDETLTALSAALTDEYPSHPGPRFPFSGLAVSPRPAQRPRPPIWVGGSSPRAVRRAALLGEGWLSQGDSLEQLPAQLGLIASVREQAGRSGPFAVNAIPPALYVGEPGWETGRRALTGKPERLAASLRRYASLGVTHLQLRPRSRSLDEYLDQLEAVATDVLPLV